MAGKTNPEIISLAALRLVRVDRATLAAFLGCTHDGSIDNYAKKGLLVKAGHGQYELLASVQNVHRHLSGLASGRAGKDENVDAAKANAELKESQKRLTELRIATMQGDLISRPDIEAAWTEISLAVKQLFLSMPARARFDLPHLTGADQKKLDELARDMLTEVAFEGEVKMPAGAGGKSAKKTKAKKTN